MPTVSWVFFVRAEIPQLYPAVKAQSRNQEHTARVAVSASATACICRRVKTQSRYLRKTVRLVLIAVKLDLGAWLEMSFSCISNCWNQLLAFLSLNCLFPFLSSSRHKKAFYSLGDVVTRLILKAACHCGLQTYCEISVKKTVCWGRQQSWPISLAWCRLHLVGGRGKILTHVFNTSCSTHLALLREQEQQGWLFPS